MLEPLFFFQGIACSSQLGCEVCRGHSHLGIRIQDVVLQLFRAVHWVDRHHHSIKAQNCKMRDHQLRTILHVQHHAIAFLHAHLAQSRSNFFCFQLQL